MYRAELTVSGRIAATLPLPAAASAFSADIAEKDRVSWVIEIDTETAELELPHCSWRSMMMPNWEYCYCCCYCRPRRRGTKPATLTLQQPLS